MSPRFLLAFLAASLIFAFCGHAEQSESARNHVELVPMLVDSAIELSEQDDPLQRAQLCKILAQNLTGSLAAAARTQDRERTVALSEMLQLVMVEGVAETLNQARVEAPLDSPKQVEVKNAAAQISIVAMHLEKVLQPDDEGTQDFQKLMKEIQAKVEQAKGDAEKRSQGKGPPPWAKKKGKKSDPK